MKAYRLNRDKQIRKEFMSLFEHRRLRIDDVFESLSSQYGLAPSTIWWVLRHQGIYKDRAFKKIPPPCQVVARE